MDLCYVHAGLVLIYTYIIRASIVSRLTRWIRNWIVIGNVILSVSIAHPLSKYFFLSFEVNFTIFTSIWSEQEWAIIAVFKKSV